jgi:hypothetical protein
VLSFWKGFAPGRPGMEKRLQESKSAHFDLQLAAEWAASGRKEPFPPKASARRAGNPLIRVELITGGSHPKLSQTEPPAPQDPVAAGCTMSPNPAKKVWATEDHSRPPRIIGATGKGTVNECEADNSRER